MTSNEPTSMYEELLDLCVRIAFNRPQVFEIRKMIEQYIEKLQQAPSLVEKATLQNMVDQSYEIQRRLLEDLYTQRQTIYELAKAGKLEEIIKITEPPPFVNPIK